MQGILYQANAGDSTQSAGEADMDTNELFNALRLECTEAGRERLITTAISEGINIDEIRQMLDYLEVHAKETHAKEAAEPAVHKGLPPGFSIQPRIS